MRLINFQESADSDDFKITFYNKEEDGSHIFGWYVIPVTDKDSKFLKGFIGIHNIGEDNESRN